MKKFIVKLICFMVIAVGIFVFLDDKLYDDRDTAWAATEDWGGQTFDIVFVGNSHVFCNINPVIINDALGLNTVCLCSSSEPMEIAYYNIKNLVSVSKPDAIVLEASMLIINDTVDTIIEAEKMGFLYNGLDGIRNLLNHGEAVVNLMPLDYWLEAFSQLFRSMNTWTRWENWNIGYHPRGVLGYISKDNLYDKQSDLKEIQEENLAAAQPASISPDDVRWQYFDKILKLAEQNNVELYIVLAPTVRSNDKYRNVMSTIDQMKKQYPAIKFVHNYHENLIEMRLQIEDFYDDGHLNRLGAVKFTEYLTGDLGNLLGIEPDFSKVGWYQSEEYEPLKNGLCRYTVKLYDGCLIKFTITDKEGNILEETDFSDQSTIETERIHSNRILRYTIKAKSEQSYTYDHEQQFTFLTDQGVLSNFTTSSIRVAKNEANRVRYTNDFNEADVRYAWYVYKGSYKEGDIYYRRGYEDYNSFDYDFTEPGHYYVVAYVRTKDKNSTSKSIKTFDFIVSQDGTITFAADQQVENFFEEEKAQTATLQEQKNGTKEFTASSIRFVQTEGGHIEFINDYNVDEVRYAWYIYKGDYSESSVYYKRGYQDDNTFDFDFTEQGTYYLKAYIRTKDENSETKSIKATEITVSQDGTVTCVIK